MRIVESIAGRICDRLDGASWEKKQRLPCSFWRFYCWLVGGCSLFRSGYWHMGVAPNESETPVDAGLAMKKHGVTITEHQFAMLVMAIAMYVRRWSLFRVGPRKLIVLLFTIAIHDMGETKTGGDKPDDGSLEHDRKERVQGEQAAIEEALLGCWCPAWFRESVMELFKCFSEKDFQSRKWGRLAMIIFILDKVEAVWRLLIAEHSGFCGSLDEKGKLTKKDEWSKLVNGGSDAAGCWTCGPICIIREFPRPLREFALALLWAAFEAVRGEVPAPLQHVDAIPPFE